ncbi:MAG: hypothetical protein IKH27_06775 [Oscillospiraceae bacterium]|nr:hypothetical protein [Oscillospiraceae bacterium]
MQREIGSNFWLEPADLAGDGTFSLSDLGIAGYADSVLTASGRAAEGIVLERILREHPEMKRIALIPPFTCETVIEPFLRCGFSVSTYPVGSDLMLTGEKLRGAIERAGAEVLLIHRYFGFETLSGCEGVLAAFRAKGGILIEDRTQCIYSAYEPLAADYVIGSLRKWLGLPDGGFAVCAAGAFPEKPEAENRAMVDMRLEASFMKAGYMQHRSDEKDRFYQMFLTSEDMLETKDTYYRIAKESALVQAAADIPALKARRRRNYQQVCDALRDCRRIRLLMPELSAGDVPLYLPLTADDRRSLQLKLRGAQIYAPVVWPKDDICPPVCAEADDIYAHVLCLPVDQRYDADDMERMTRLITEWDKEEQL